jgi:hypothetical protein
MPPKSSSGSIPCIGEVSAWRKEAMRTVTASACGSGKLKLFLAGDSKASQRIGIGGVDSYAL